MMKVPTPRECGLPEKFDKWRPGQEEALRLLLTCQSRHVAMCAPTGSGKSAIAVAYAKLTQQPTCVVTATKALQEQYLGDFQSVGMVDLRGRNNYSCQCRPEDPNYTCESGYVTRCPYKGTIACPSSQAEMRAAVSSLVVTNYAKWTHSKAYGQGMSHFKQVIFDEGHNSPEALADAMQVLLNAREVEDGLGVDFPQGSAVEDMQAWKRWANESKGVADVACTAAHARILGNDPKPAWVQHYTHMRNLVRKLATLALARPVDWVVDTTDFGYKFDPIRPGRYGEHALYMGMPKVITISATLRPKTMFMCGVAKDQFTFKEFPSDFDPRRSPVYYVPVMRVDRRADDLGMLWAMLDRIAARRRNVKAVVHTISYDRQREITERSRFSSSMLVNLRGSPAIETIEDFYQSGPGTILVSPVVGEGYDFKQDLARWQFLCKIPFEPPSKIVKAREAADPEYRPYQAVQYMVQAFGRIMREADDWGENFICDSHMDWFWPRYSHLAPKSFHKVFQRRDILPTPLEIRQ